MGEELKLLGMLGSPFSWRIEIALKLKGLEYNYVEEFLSNKSPLLLKSNPIHKKVPVLLHKEKPIVESLVILEYIDETWPHNPILPKDPYERSQARFWAKFFDDKCIFTIWKAFSTKDEEERKKAAEESNEMLTILENEVENNLFYKGESSIGLVDIVNSFIAVLLPTIQEAAGWEILTKEKYPKLSEWSDQFLSHSVVKGNTPPRDKLLARFQAILGTSKASN